MLAASRVCWICGHDGSTQADHVLAISLDVGQRHVTNQAMMRPAHGNTADARCYLCDPAKGRACNQERGNGLREPKVERSRSW